jgi:hypothetical protein
MSSTPRKIPNFHDGYFDGLRLGPNQLVQIFLRTVDGKSFVLELEGVQRLAVGGVKEGNIILDLLIRTGDELTLTDIESAYDISTESSQVARWLASARESHLQVLEINPSYGAEGTILFRSWKIGPVTSQP